MANKKRKSVSAFTADELAISRMWGRALYRSTSIKLPVERAELKRYLPSKSPFRKTVSPLAVADKTARDQILRRLVAR